MTAEQSVPKIKRTVHREILRGSAWAVLLRWIVRLTGLISTVILARLLTPADFGIVAMAMIIVGGIEVLNETGQKLALIRHPAPTREHYDTAWTLSLLIGLAVALVIVAAAPLATYAFHEPRAVPVIQWLALRALLGGFENIGIVNFRRDLDFARDFRYSLFQKLIAFVATIVAAIIWRNYWALVVGIIASRAGGTVLSYVMHPYRPRISFRRSREIWSFSSWLLTKCIGQYVNLKVDEIAVGVGFGAVLMGSYSVAADLGAAPTQEIATPVSSALFPIFATIHGDTDKLRQSYFDVLNTMVMLCVPISVGIALVSPPLVLILLGGKWAAISPLVGWLAVASGVLAISNTAYVIFDVTGHPRISAQMQWTRVIVLAIAVVAAAKFGGTLQIAIARFVATVVMVPALFRAAEKVLAAHPTEFIRAVWPAIISTVIMSAAVLSFQYFVPLAIPVIRLFADATLGAAVFTGSILYFWMARGYPSGPERAAVSLAQEFFRDRLQLPLRRRFAGKHGL